MAAAELPTATVGAATRGTGMIRRLLILFVLAFIASAGLNYLQLGNMAAARADAANTARALASAQKEIADKRSCMRWVMTP
jgi:hypothetical protein